MVTGEQKDKLEEDFFALGQFERKPEDDMEKARKEAEVKAAAEAQVQVADEPVRRRRKRKKSDDVRVLKRLGWTQAQINRLDAQAAAEAALRLTPAPKKWSRRGKGA